MSSTSLVRPPPGGDARREGGERTRRRLISAAQQLIAERGEGAIRLRNLTALAGTNVASVNYHFGGLGTLLAAATADAVERIVDAQVAEIESLAAGASLQETAAAYFRPMLDELVGPAGKGRAYVRVLARAASDPPRKRQAWAAAATARAHEALVGRLRILLPGLSEEELLFRVKCVGGILVLLSSTALEADVQGRTLEDMDRMLMPVVAGALVGG